jgi:predicted nucleic acid-binding protein
MRADIFVDSNVFLYAGAPDDPRHAMASRLLRHLLANSRVAVSPQVLGEVCTNLRRNVGVEAATARALGILEVCEVRTLDERTTTDALRIMGRYGFDYWDSQIVAAAVAADVRFLTTEDLQDGQVIEGVTVVNPFSPGFDVRSLD